jgi:hypothetical protein
MNAVRSIKFSVMLFLFSALSFSQTSGLANQDLTQCLLSLNKGVSDNENIYNASVDILFFGADRERNALLSICRAFGEQPAALRSHVVRMVENRVMQVGVNRPIKQLSDWPINDGKIYYTLPGTRNYMARFPTSPSTRDYLTQSFGDFIDVDADGYPDYVISFFTPAPPWDDNWVDATSYYYRAVFLSNKGNGWRMVSCEYNMQENFGSFAFLVVPCPT